MSAKLVASLIRRSIYGTDPEYSTRGPGLRKTIHGRPAQEVLAIRKQREAAEWFGLTDAEKDRRIRAQMTERERELATEILDRPSRAEYPSAVERLFRARVAPEDMPDLEELLRSLPTEITRGDLESMFEVLAMSASAQALAAIMAVITTVKKEVVRDRESGLIVEVIERRELEGPAKKSTLPTLSNLIRGQFGLPPLKQ